MSEQEGQAEFQTVATRRVAAILARHGISATFATNETPGPYVFANFDFGGSRFRLEIYEREIGLEINEGRVDSEIFAHINEEAKLNDFERRLERVLNGGDWFGNEDPTLRQAAAQSFRGCFSWCVKWWKTGP